MNKDNNLTELCLRRVVLWTVGASVVGLRRVRQLPGSGGITDRGRTR